jgi:hypothetical protein
VILTEEIGSLEGLKHRQEDNIEMCLDQDDIAGFGKMLEIS